MTRNDIINALVERTGFLSKSEASMVVRVFFQFITNSLIEGKKVELRGLGSFRVRERGPRIGRNPRTGEKVYVEKKQIPYFKPGKDLSAIEEE